MWLNIITKSNYWRKWGWGSYFTLPLTVYEGKWGHELQTEPGGRSQNRGHRGMGLTGLLYECSACFLTQPRSTFLVVAPSTFVLVLLQRQSINGDNASEACPEAEPVEAFLNWSSLFLDDPRLCRLTGNSTVAYTGSDWFPSAWFLLQCCSSEENNQEKTAQTTSRSFRKM